MAVLIRVSFPLTSVRIRRRAETDRLVLRREMEDKPGLVPALVSLPADHRKPADGFDSALLLGWGPVFPEDPGKLVLRRLTLRF